jgi:Ca2+-transporting ATPase
MERPWTKPVEQALAELGVDPHAGISEAEAQRRLEQYGPNELQDKGVKSPWRILWEQLTGVMVVVLIIAAVISGVLGVIEYRHSGSMAEIYDAIAIAVIVVLNALLGLWQEYRAEKAMAALKKMAVPVVRVRRDGEVKEISATRIVPGDLVYLEAGTMAPADFRLVEAANLRIQEAALTGESEPVEKQTAPLAGEELGVGDRRNMAHMGTVVTYGRGTGLAVRTGMSTELGAIATMIQSVVQEPTPLQKRLTQLGHGLAIAALMLVSVIFVQGILRGGVGIDNLKEMFLTAISMAVAAVPEGLPAVVTISLALGAQRMLKRRALVRKLLAVETLGSVTTICSDKTGTLTENRMTVVMADLAGQQVNFSEHVRRGVAEIAAGAATGPETPGTMGLLLGAAALCNDAVLKPGERPGRFSAVGDPTEGALVVAAAHVGLVKDALEKALPRVAEAPFDSDRKRMTTVHALPSAAGDLPAPLRTLADEGKFVAFTKGAVDSLLKVCTHVRPVEQVVPLDEPWRQRILEANNRFAQQGMRVLGVAMRMLEAPPTSQTPDALEQGLVFVGMVGMIDPPRAEVKLAVQTCREAGIRPVMITGDHPLTAWAIASELGIAREGDKSVTGEELERMELADLEAQVQDVSVYARVSPEHKLKIVQALKDRGHVVAMTGDGVNDAPALKKADIGVAMGITGTDVAKEASDMVLQDDNFATIVAAVEQGRVIYDNIRKFIKYLLTTNSGEILVMFFAPLLGLPLPLIPLQILWINLVTDGLPALALGVEPAEKNIMRRPPMRTGAGIFADGMVYHILWVGALMAGICLLAAEVAWWVKDIDAKHHIQYFRTMAFTVVTLTQMAHVLAIRSGKESLFKAGVFSNLYLAAAVAATISLQLALIYVPFLQGIFETVSLSAADLAIAVALSSVIFWAVEIEKWIQRRRVARAA